jgi:ribosome biogenesis GTPase
MSQRKLNRRQTWRVEKIQQEKAERAHKKEQVIEQKLGAGELGNEVQGRVVAHFGSQAEVELLSANYEKAVRYRCFLRANLGSLVTGDEVVFRPSSEVDGVLTGVIEAVLERRSELSRPNPYNEIKPVAANIDSIVLVIAPEPEAHVNLIDRYLVAAENCHIEPLLLLNKTDLLDENNHGRFYALLAHYEALGYRTLSVSSKNQQHLAELKAFLNGRTSVFVGQSGVGKSSLIAALLPGTELKVGALSENTRKGKHTTTTARLYHFPSGGHLIDSPGIREFGLWHMSASDVLYGFRELRALEGYCRFRDCAHEAEPGCAFSQAVKNGEVKAERFDSFKRIVKTLSELK